MELKKLAKSTSYLMFSRGVTFIVGIIRSKFAAVYLGTTGVGIFSQMFYLATLFSNISQLSMNDGFVKQIAERKDSEDFKAQIGAITKTYVSLILIIFLLASIVGLLFSNQLTIYVFGDIKYHSYYLVALCILPIVILNSINFSFLKSHKLTKEISRSNIIVGVIDVFIFVPLIFLYGITGAVISVVVNYFLLFITNEYFARKSVFSQLNLNVKSIFSSKISKSYANELLTFALFGTFASLFQMFSEFASRAILISQLGVDRLGVYSPIITWSGLVRNIILPSLSIYLYPRLCEAKSNMEINGVINDVLRLMTFFLIPFVILAITTRFLIIPLFYSNEFLEAAKYLPWHFGGMIFYMWMGSLTVILAPIGKIKVYGVLYVFMNLIDLAVVYFLVPQLGLYGWMLKFIISPIIFFFVYLFYLHKTIDLNIKKENIFLMVYFVLAIFMLTTYEITFGVRNSLPNYMIAVFFLVVTAIFMSKSEFLFLKSKLKTIFNYL